MTTMPDHVVWDVDFDHFNGGDAIRRLDYLGACAKRLVIGKESTDYREYQTGSTVVEIHHRKPELSVVLSEKGNPVRTRFLFTMPYDQAILDGLIEDPDEGVVTIVRKWRTIIDRPGIRLSEGSCNRSLVRMDAASREVDALLARAISRTAAVIALNNPSREARSPILLRSPCMARPGAITDDRNKPLLSAALEKAILAEVPNVVVLHRRDGNSFELKAHKMTETQGTAFDGSTTSALRLVDGLPDLDKPLLKAAMGAGL